jgi:hypothetical protein
MDVLIAVLAVGGLGVLFVGMIYSNVAVYLMAKYWNRGHSEEQRIPAWAAWGKGAYTYQPISKYRKETGDGPLYKQLRIGYWLCGIGGASAAVGICLAHFLVGHS